MPRLTKSEIDQELLKGAALPWSDGAKSVTLQLATPVQRRLFKFLNGSGTRTVKNIQESFITALHAAFDAAEDPAKDVPPPPPGPPVPGPWRLTRIRTEGFGGINTWKGKPFEYDIDREGLYLDGPNGAGKSSLIGAIIWGLTGDRPRDTGVNIEATSRQDVFNSSGTKVGDWPPIACYPDDSSSFPPALPSCVWGQISSNSKRPYRCSRAWMKPLP